MKGIIEELSYVFKSLDKSTVRWLIVMVVTTIILSGIMIKTFDNPVFEKWGEERGASRIIKERQSIRNERQNEIEVIEEDNEGSGDKDPVF